MAPATNEPFHHNRSMNASCPMKHRVISRDFTDPQATTYIHTIAQSYLPKDPKNKSKLTAYFVYHPNDVLRNYLILDSAKKNSMAGALKGNKKSFISKQIFLVKDC